MEMESTLLSRQPQPYQSADVCNVCAQLHTPSGVHFYDYYHPVDPDLTCPICRQPLVEPVDTKCGHTFCKACLQNHVTKEGNCPVDRLVLAEVDIQPSSIMVRR